MSMYTPLVIPNAPVIPGLVFRPFRGESDYPYMAALLAACNIADGMERSTNVDDINRTYRHLENCDPQTDMLFTEVNGLVIAYGRIWWQELADGICTYHPFGFVHPDWRGQRHRYNDVESRRRPGAPDFHQPSKGNAQVFPSRTIRNRKGIDQPP